MKIAGGNLQENLSDFKLCLKYESFGVAGRDRILPGAPKLDHPFGCFFVFIMLMLFTNLDYT